MEQIYSVSEFQQISDSLEMSISELCDYPVIFPIKKPERISSDFGMRYHPIYRVWRFHTGIDISATNGTPVYATGNGIVTRMGNCPGYGIYIEIQHARFPLVLRTSKLGYGICWRFGRHSPANSLRG